MSALYESRRARAEAIRAAGGGSISTRLDAAISSGAIPRILDLALSEALVLGLLRQGVRKYVGIFGHGSTEIGEALRAYADSGLIEVYNVRSEIEASHVAMALRRSYGEAACVFTSIGPGALQALAASLVGLSDGIGAYYLFGDETTEDEGYNMQQVPRREQAIFLKLCSAMGPSYSLHTPQALPEALRRGAEAVHGGAGERPFFLLLPMNVQGSTMEGFNLDRLPGAPRAFPSAPVSEVAYREAAELIKAASRVTVKVGNGAFGLGGGGAGLLDEFLRRADAAYVHGPQAVGILPGSHPRNMTVGGSKGSVPGNAAMAEADLAVVIGARAVCQWDSSGTAWKSAKAVISINARLEDADHYNRSLPLVGDAGAVLGRLVAALREGGVDKGSSPTAWSGTCAGWRREWDQFVASRVAVGALRDPKLDALALTQPAAIAEVAAFCRGRGFIKYFDAGDVQANGFQIVEDETPGDTFTETGASYMGFAVSALVAGAVADQPRYAVAITGDGSFMMSPQVLVDAVQHGVRGMVVLLDNRRMAAISGLQRAQYGMEFRTDDRVVVDYAAMAEAVQGVRAFRVGLVEGAAPVEGATPESLRAALRAALEDASCHEGLSLVHVAVYAGPDERGGLGAYGDWNVGPWCADVQAEKRRLGL